MLTRIIIIYIAVPFRIQPHHPVDIHGSRLWLHDLTKPGAGLQVLGGRPRCLAATLAVLAQPGRNQDQPDELEQPIGDKRHQCRRNRPGENCGYIIQ